ncbi:MAG: Asp-tRNA(Asn)/Glu-tRNA(Gln) amidotransferase subunit GatB [Bacteroidota bacterium]
MSIYDSYETVIGLEVHIQLSTQSKAFCADSTQFGAEPNTQISAISLGYPGTLPRLNKKQLEYAIRLGLAIGCRINQHNRFDRKNYFYADLPKGYQITQDQAPVCIGGSLSFDCEGVQKSIRIHHIHMEEDAGKSLHDLDPQYSFIDLNRAGVPLLEVVTEPDFRSAAEVDAFMNAMRRLVRYLDISDGNMEEGSMRCDCNISVRPKGQSTYGERCEVKNLNSMRFARRAISYERKRQIDLIEKGGQVEQQTLNFNPQTGVTTPLRDKEDAHDYRYFPDPDLPPVVVSDAEIEAIRSSLPQLPKAHYQKFTQSYQLSDYDARLLVEERSIAEYFEALCQKSKRYKAIANLLINKIIPYLQESQIGIGDYPIAPKGLLAFIELIASGQVSSAIAYQRILPALQKAPSKTAHQVAQALNLLQTNDESFLKDLVDEVLAAFPDKVAVYKKGKKGLLGFFMGEVMKRSKGKANPGMSKKLLTQKLEA